MTKKNYIIGIDYGTTNSCVTVFKNGKIIVICNDFDNRLTPSMVTFTKNYPLIGDEAKSNALVYYENTIFETKRLCGVSIDDYNVKSNIMFWPFTITDISGKPYIQVKYKNKNKILSPEQISAMILTKLKENAEDYLGQEVTDAVITVPAYFNGAQRQAIKDAGTIAGLHVLRIINEPTAAAIAFGYLKKDNIKKNILVYDFGGGTLDVSILTIHNEKFDVIATSGDTNLGGCDFDNCLTMYLIKKFRKEYGSKCRTDISNNAKAIRRLHEKAESAKKKLSTYDKTLVSIDSLHENIDFEVEIKRSTFESINANLFERILIPIENAINDSDLSKSDIDEIILVGGSTRIPKVRSLISEYFNGKKINRSVNPDEAVAKGAGIFAHFLAENQNKKNRNNKNQNIFLNDVLPISLGTETNREDMTVLIKRNTPIPVRITKAFSTATDYQESVLIKVYEGEDKLTKNNNLLGKLVLDNIQKAKRRKPKINVTFDIDENSILNVSVVEESTGLSKKITITNKRNRLTEKDIERMIKENKKFIEDEKQEFERKDLINDFENYIYEIKNFKVSQMNIDELNMIINTAIQWISNNSEASIQDIIKQQNIIKKKVNSIIYK